MKSTRPAVGQWGLFSGRPWDRLLLMKNKTSILLLFVCSFASCFPTLKDLDRLSNGIVEVQVDPKTGSSNILDLKNNQTLIENSKIAFRSPTISN